MLASASAGMTRLLRFPLLFIRIFFPLSELVREVGVQESFARIGRVDVVAEVRVRAELGWIGTDQVVAADANLGGRADGRFSERIAIAQIQRRPGVDLLLLASCRVVRRVVDVTADVVDREADTVTCEA